MFPSPPQVFSAIAITAIIIIMSLYFLVMKRKGWLREDSHGSYYRCPNPECRKIFDKPVVITDLSSENPTHLHSACPHCGFNLETVSPVRTTKKLEKAAKTSLKLEEPLEQVEAQKITKEKLLSPPSKSLQARPPECRHFFGYLKKSQRTLKYPTNASDAQKW